ncbi:MAG: TusE/DsrC/DsvC family sulfur relay protein [Gammaproteobacteria bacterium SHHR-1]
MATLNPLITETRSQFSGQDLWSEEMGLAVAEELGIEMTPAHWQVIHFLREQCELTDGMCNARKVIRALQDRFHEQGGKRYLYSLFPGGPVRQANRIADLPMPPETLDMSFGSVH